MPKISRDQVAQMTLQVLRPGEGSRPDVRVIAHEGERLVIKDYSRGNAALRLLGLFLTSREQGAYALLDGLPGVPRWRGRLDPFTMVLEYVAGEPAATAPLAQLTPQFFAGLEALIAAMHARGVAHGDLKRLDNILITPAGEPVLIDFSAAFWHGSNPLSAIVFPYLYDDDRRAVYKLKYRRVPALLTPEEEAFLNHMSWTERFFRWAREYFRRPVKRLAGAEPE